MARPQYANAFTATFNPKLGELILNFSQEYPIVTPVAQVDKSEAVQFETSPVREDVCGVVLPADIAHQLLEVLKKTFSESNATE